MDIYKLDNISTLLKNNEYAGRGIVIGTSPDKKMRCARILLWAGAKTAETACL